MALQLPFKLAHPAPNLQTYMQLASIGHGNTPIEQHIGADVHPMVQEGHDIDPVLNLLMHAAHPTDDSPTAKAISDHIQQAAELGARMVQQGRVPLDADHTLKLNKDGSAM